MAGLGPLEAFLAQEARLPHFLAGKGPRLLLPLLQLPFPTQVHLWARLVLLTLQLPVQAGWNEIMKIHNQNID